MIANKRDLGTFFFSPKQGKKERPQIPKGEKKLKYTKIIVFIIILIMAIFLGIFRNNILKLFYPKKYSEIVSVYSEKYQVDDKLIYAVIKAESNFDEKAVSHKDAVGLMQLMENTALEVASKYNISIDLENTKEDIANIQNNINIGTKYLSVLIEKYGNTELAVAAYNAGIGTVDNWIEKGMINKDGSNIENIPYKETNNYVRKILRNYKVYRELY